MNKWNTSDIKEAFGLRLNYSNWEEIYNKKGEIIGGILYRERKMAMMFEIFKKGKEIRIHVSTPGGIYFRQNLEEDGEKNINKVMFNIPEKTKKEIEKDIKEIENYLKWE